jgi:transcriptional regulator with XRE-family HTH domain
VCDTLYSLSVTYLEGDLDKTPPLAESLRELRTAAGLSTYQLAERLGWAQTKVSRIERGTTTPIPSEVAAWAEATGADQATAAELTGRAVAAETRTRSWRAVHGKGLAARQREMARIRESMTGFREYANACVPGLLQTPPYAAHILELADVSGQGGVPEAVAQRMNNQAIIYDPSRTFEYVITEAALRYRAGPPEVMRAQGEKILSAMSLPNMTISVLPVGASPAVLVQSGFVIYRIPDNTLILVELLTTETQIRTVGDVRLYERAFDLLKESSVTGRKAERLIREAMVRSTP